MSKFEQQYNTDYIVHLYVNKKFTLKDIAEHLDCNIKTPYRHLKKAGVERRSGVANTIKPEKNVFKPPLSAKGAYFLGLLFADGNLSKSSYKVGIASKDKKILVKFRKFVNCGNIRQRKNNNHEVRSPRKWIHTRLKNLGLRPNKSQKNVMLHENGYEKYVENKKIEKDYWRGVIDGDGSIRFNQGLARIKFVNSILDAHQKLNKFVDRNGFRKLTISKRKNGSWYESFRTGEPARKIVSHLYSDPIEGPVIQRKKDYFESEYN